MINLHRSGIKELTVQSIRSLVRKTGTRFYVVDEDGSNAERISKKSVISMYKDVKPQFIWTWVPAAVFGNKIYLIRKES